MTLKKEFNRIFIYNCIYKIETNYNIYKYLLQLSSYGKLHTFDRL